MLEATLLSIKRKNLMRKFKSFEVKYRAKYLGEAMARVGIRSEPRGRPGATSGRNSGGLRQERYRARRR